MDESLTPKECSDSPYRSNPPLPAGFDDYDELLDADFISGTAFSKQWLFTVLMRLIQEVDKQNEPGHEESDFGVDVNEDLQDELCNLWDMSMNSDVVVFMHEFKSVELLSAVIVKSRAPRVTEICVGILGNLACDQTVCSEMSSNPEFINMVLLLLENPDGLCLVQIVRLLYCCLQNEEHSRPWVAAIKDHEGNILELIKFIMASSTNVELLKNVGELLNLLFDLEDELCGRWSTTDMLTAMLEAVKEIGFQPCPALEVFIHNFQLMSCSQNGVAALESLSQSVLEVLMKYLMYICDEPIVPVDLKAKYLAAILSLINLIFLQKSKFDIDSFYKIDMFPKCLFKILESLFPYIYHPVESLQDSGSSSSNSGSSGNSGNSGSSSSGCGNSGSSGNSGKSKKKTAPHPPPQHSLSVVEDLTSFKTYQWKKDTTQCDPSLVMLYKSLQESFLHLTSHIPKKSREESQWSCVLHYLDTECSEVYLRYLLLILKDGCTDHPHQHHHHHHHHHHHTNSNPFQHLKLVSDSNGLYRLHHVMRLGGL
ncbi:protein saal1-like [Argonauta hians]